MSDAMAATECTDELKEAGMDHAQARVFLQMLA